MNVQVLGLEAYSFRTDEGNEMSMVRVYYGYEATGVEGFKVGSFQLRAEKYPAGIGVGADVELEIDLEKKRVVGMTKA